MSLKRRKSEQPFSYKRCQCGWVGTSKQLAIWLRKDQIVSRICPQCGTPSPLRQNLIFLGQPSSLVH